MRKPVTPHPVGPRPTGARPSGLGLVVMIVAAVGVVAGWRLGWVELAVIGATSAGALVAAGLLTLGRSPYGVTLELVSRRVTVGHRATARVAVRNVSGRRTLPARIEVPVGGSTGGFALPSLAPGAEYEDVFTVPTSRRAVVSVGPVRSTRGDPFGLLRRQVRWGEGTELFVHPELVPLTGAAAGVLRDLEGRATRVISDSDLSFHALRDYVAGDDRRHIHWRSSARLGELMVRQFEDTRLSHTTVALATAGGEYADDDEFELAVAVAASIGVAERRADRGLTFLAGTEVRSDGPVRLLDGVAAVTRTPDGREAGDLARWVRTTAPATTIAVLVVGSGAALAELRAHRLPPGVQVVVIRCAVGAEAEVHGRGATATATVGRLADLPRLVRGMVS